MPSASKRADEASGRSTLTHQRRARLPRADRVRPGAAAPLPATGQTTEEVLNRAVRHESDPRSRTQASSSTRPSRRAVHVLLPADRLDSEVPASVLARRRSPCPDEPWRQRSLRRRSADPSGTQQVQPIPLQPSRWLRRPQLGRARMMDNDRRQSPSTGGYADPSRGIGIYSGAENPKGPT